MNNIEFYINTLCGKF